MSRCEGVIDAQDYLCMQVNQVHVSEEEGHCHMTVLHVIKSYVWESHMKPYSHRAAA